MGSTRAGRLCPRITAWVEQVGRECSELSFETIDLNDWLLPMDDEPVPPALGPYSQPHTRAWSDKVRQADAVVFVTPQFNWGYPAVLKNAIDHLYPEWHGKPAALVTYGGHGGTRCGRQLRQVAAGVKMDVVATAPALTLPEAVIRHNAPFDPERDFSRCRVQVRRAIRQLAARVDGREFLLGKLHRHWKQVVAAV